MSDTNTRTDSEIVETILAEMSASNGGDFEGTEDQLAELADAVGRMREDGASFDDDEILSLVDGDEEERDAYFEGYDGYDVLTRILDEIFNG